MRCRCRRRAIKRETGLPSQSPTVTAPPKGEPLAGRAALNWMPEAQYGAKGRALLQRPAASGQRTLSSCRESRQQGTTVFEISSFAHPVQALPTRQWLPLWGQQRRPPPAAETGSRCWGRGQQDVSAFQSTKRMLGAATRLWHCEAMTERARTLKEKMNE